MLRVLGVEVGIRHLFVYLPLKILLRKILTALRKRSFTKNRMMKANTNTQKRLMTTFRE